MDYGNNGTEFNWSYMGGQGGGHGGQAGQSMSVYPQMGQMNPGDYANTINGGGRQWLHSNQANNFQPAMSPSTSQSAPYEAYNQSMMRYANPHKTGGEGMGMGQMGMSQMGGNYGGYGGGMSRNGLAGGMGRGAQNGNSNW
ncbi:heterogeneous nuclear ribonucleoprotein A2 homolog 1 [Drosophila grimshawi]|uniref:GH13526 n=1 Tax=Drosophila grimshawi TaxID=7222 RepID=B4JPI7_DROGR|nr:heterogeneous nuclear ribonucleoprotein A2 homolog 1 [Drosophila grimshawi]EDV98817.1 GH13526 [Drosophila grimshawi]